MRETSSRSSTRRTTWRTCRVDQRALLLEDAARRAAASPAASVRIGASGLRSSWPSIAMNSSFARVASSATARASSAACFCRRALQLRLDARHQLARRERLDQVVVRAGVQAVDARLVAGARRQHDDGDGRQLARPARRRRSSAKPSSAGIITSVRIRSGGSRSAAASAAAPSATASTGQRALEDPPHVVAHVRVVVGEQDPRAAPSARRGRRRAPALVGHPAQRLRDVRRRARRRRRQRSLGADRARRAGGRCRAGSRR